MAQEAVLKVKKAEDEGKEALRRANEQARQLISDARGDALERRGKLIQEANAKRQAMIAEASAKAKADCDALLREGEAERQRLLSPAADKREQAINFIIERIVS